VVARRPDGVRYAAVVLYGRGSGRFDFGMKIMDEPEGPNYYDFPVAWLEGLPPPIAYAAGWREKVRASSRNRSGGGAPGRVAAQGQLF
jgi:hypothetical protein